MHTLTNPQVKRKLRKKERCSIEGLNIKGGISGLGKKKGSEDKGESVGEREGRKKKNKVTILISNPRQVRGGQKKPPATETGGVPRR